MSDTDPEFLLTDLQTLITRWTLQRTHYSDVYIAIRAFERSLATAIEAKEGPAVIAALQATAVEVAEHIIAISVPPSWPHPSS